MTTIFPDYTEEQQLAEVIKVQKWLKAQPMAKRVLVKVLLFPYFFSLAASQMLLIISFL